MRCPVTPKNEHVNDTIPNSETQTNPNLTATFFNVANVDIDNGNAVQRKGIKSNKRPHRKNEENKWNNQSATLN